MTYILMITFMRFYFSGVGAMEVVATDMKLRGMYIARQLSYKGVSFEIEEVPLTPEFRNAYDRLVEWVRELQCTVILSRNNYYFLLHTSGSSHSHNSIKRSTQRKTSQQKRTHGVHSGERSSRVLSSCASRRK